LRFGRTCEQLLNMARPKLHNAAQEAAEKQAERPLQSPPEELPPLDQMLAEVRRRGARKSAWEELAGTLYDQLVEERRRFSEYRQAMQVYRTRQAERMNLLEQPVRTLRKLLQLVAQPASKDLFQNSIVALTAVMQARYGAILLLDSGRQYKEVIFTGKPPGKTGEIHTFLQQRKPLVDQVVQDRRTLKIDNLTAYCRSRNLPVQNLTFQTFLAAPIADESEVFGCAYVCEKLAGGTFDDDAADTLSNYCDALAAVLRQARERAERRRAELEREVFGRLGLELSGAETLEQVSICVGRACQMLLKSTQFRLLTRRAGTGWFLPVTPDGPVATSDRTCELGVEYLGGTPAMHHDTWVCAIPGQALVLGVIEVTPNGELEAHEVGVLQQIAHTVGPALARCRAESISRVLASFGRALGAATTPQEAAEIVVQAADELIGWDSCVVHLIPPGCTTEPAVLHMDVVEGMRQHVYPEPDYKLSPLAQRTVDAGPQLVLRETAALQGDTSLIGSGEPSASLMYAQLRAAGQVTGILAIHSYRFHAYDRIDLDLLQDLADHCGPALERTRIQALAT